MQRDPCKNCNFGIFYGLTDTGLLDLIALTYATAGMDLPDWLTKEWCADFIQQWFRLYTGVEEYLKKQHYRARRYGVVWDLFGRCRWVPEVRSVHRSIESAGLRQAGNMPVQATCAGLMKLAIAEIQDHVIDKFAREGILCNPLMTVHDEMLVEVEEGYGELLKMQMEAVMEDVLTDKQTGESLCRVEVKAEGKTMERWAK